MLEAAAEGRAGEVLTLARTLAADVLASAPVVLAMRVLAGGPHAVVAAIELAEALAFGDEASPPRRQVREGG